MSEIISKYAELLVRYCLNVQKGDKLMISSTILGESLVREVYREALRAGAALVETELTFRGKDHIFLENASDEALQTTPTLYKSAVETFDCHLTIRAPFNLRENANVPAETAKVRAETMSPLSKIWSERTATRALRRNLCQFPTDAAAQEAGMNLEEYEQFVFSACKLFEPDPRAAWLEVRENQQKITNKLNSAKQVRYRSPLFDIKFGTENRTWINSDGQTNMPSGEVYTSPVEDSVEGVVHFTHPCIYQGHEVEGVTLTVKNGLIEKWEARRGQAFLDYIFSLEGTRRFGEAAIGTNYGINRLTKNILFDEKMGGTIHMAVGQSYLQTGGKNQSSLHWDMITDMTDGGEIFADGELIYRNGLFLI
jgi:aminopeptidase